MRPTGPLHLGNYHGALRNWVELQYQYECFFFIADWHMLTTGYEDTTQLPKNIRTVLIDYLAAGLNPGVCTLFVQSHVPEHAELHLLLSMITPLGWLERVPTYKDQQEALKEKDLATYGFLGYPLLQSADILLYRPAFVPVGEDQVAHRGDHARDRAPLQPSLWPRAGLRSEGGAGREESRRPQLARRYKQLRRKYQETRRHGSRWSRRARSCRSNNRITVADKERLLGYLEGSGVTILPEPQVLLTATPKVPGLDGGKMSKSCGNTIGLREDPDDVAKKMRQMQTDPARVRRTDPGTPEKCPVWDLHKLYSDETTRSLGLRGAARPPASAASTAKPVIDKVVEEITTMRKRAQEFEESPELLRNIVAEGAEKCARARRDARSTKCVAPCTFARTDGRT